MNDEIGTKGLLEIRERKLVRVSGVLCIIGFDEDYVFLETTLGRLTIEGEGMKIENLSKEEGIADISGKIVTASYTEEKKHKGFFSRFTAK